MKTAGIDLGTTNTVLASAGRVLTLAGTGKTILPSVVAFPPAGGHLVGEAARERRPIDPKNTIYSAKRIMGASITSYRAQEFQRNYPFDLVQDRMGTAAFQTRSGVFTARDIATKVVEALLAETKLGGANLGGTMLSAVVTVPAAFEEHQWGITRRALRDAGITQVRMVEEPVATAIAYLERSNIKYGVVYDLGGGTFDLAVLDCTTRPFRIVAHGGDPYLGGDDVDRVLANFVRERVLKTAGWDLGSDPETYDRLVMRVEAAKCRLSEANDAVIDVSDVDAAAPTGIATVRIDRAQTMALASDLVRRTFAICDEVLARAGVRTKDIDAVFLAGGATLLPGVKEHVQEYFGKRPRHDVPALDAVAIGASLAAIRPGLAGLLEEDETNA